MSDMAGNAGGGCGSRGRNREDGDKFRREGWTRNYLWGKLFYPVSWDITWDEKGATVSGRFAFCYETLYFYNFTL